MASPAVPFLLAVAAAATSASQLFRDVPADHWAERAVTHVAVERAFMVGYPDKTFRGQAAFTRTQLVYALDELIDELEALSRTTWAPPAPVSVAGLPADPTARRRIQRVAGRYGLYAGMPGYQPAAFDGQRSVTRYEMAWLIARLLRLGEVRGVVDPGVLEPRTFTFTDLPRGDWQGAAEPVVRDVADRYQVMIGFPNGVFRGLEKLTRYQFAAAAAQTFPLIRQLVIKTQARKLNPPTPAPTPVPTQPAALPTPAPRFLEGALLQAGPLVRGNGLVSLGGFARGAYYAGPWFLLADAQLGVGVCSTEVLHGGTLGLGYAQAIGPATHIQPFLGGRLVSTGGTHLAGAAFGAIASLRPAGPWGYYAIAQGATPLWATGGAKMGVLPQGTAGLTYALAPGLALSAEASYGLWPYLFGGTGTALNTDPAMTGGLGLVTGF